MHWPIPDVKVTEARTHKQLFDSNGIYNRLWDVNSLISWIKSFLVG